MKSSSATSRSTAGGPGTTSIFSPAMNSPIANSRVSPGRNGKNSPHSTKMMARLSQNSWSPKLSSNQLGSIQSMPSSIGWSRAVMRSR